MNREEWITARDKLAAYQAGPTVHPTNLRGYADRRMEAMFGPCPKPDPPEAFIAATWFRINPPDRKRITIGDYSFVPADIPTIRAFLDAAAAYFTETL